MVFVVGFSVVVVVGFSVVVVVDNDVVEELAVEELDVDVSVYCVVVV